MNTNKSILIIDTPLSCKDCDILFIDEYSYYCPWIGSITKGDVYNYVNQNIKPDWCPLKPYKGDNKCHE